MSEWDEEDDVIAPDFHQLVFDAQVNELMEEEKRRADERERARQLMLKSQPQARTLIQIVGARTQQEIEKQFEEKMVGEESKDLEAEKKRAAEEEARLVTKFPPPNL